MFEELIMEKKNRAPVTITIVGLSYIAVGALNSLDVLMSGNIDPVFIVLKTLCIIFGILLFYNKKPVVILALLAPPLFFILVGNDFITSQAANTVNVLSYTPFHHLSFLILTKISLLSTWPVVKWGMFLLYYLLILPYFLQKGDKGWMPALVIPKAVKKRTIDFKFPESIRIFEKNAFNVLGIIPIKANVNSSVKRKKDLAVLVKANLAEQADKHIKKDYYRVPWPGTAAVSELEINSAFAKLQDAGKSIEEELLWFHLEGNHLGTFKCLVNCDFQEVKRCWQEERRNRPNTYAAALALHNLAVLEHALVLLQEKTAAKKPGMEKMQRERWKNVFDLWREVSNNNKCWEYFQKRKIYMNEPGMDKSYFNDLPRRLQERVLKINLDIARAARAQGLSDYSKQHLDLIENSGFDEKAISKINREFFKNDIKNLEIIRRNLRNGNNGNPNKNPYQEYENTLEKAAKIKKGIDAFNGGSFTKKEFYDIVTIIRVDIKEDFNETVGKFYQLLGEINTKANLLIKLLNGIAMGTSSANAFSILQGISKTNILKESFGQDGEKIGRLKSAAGVVNIAANKRIKLLKKARKLCKDDESISKVTEVIDMLVLEKYETAEKTRNTIIWLNDNFNRMSSIINL
jgi:hypothetical protein